MSTKTEQDMIEAILRHIDAQNLNTGGVLGIKVRAIVDTDDGVAGVVHYDTDDYLVRSALDDPRPICDDYRLN